MLKLMPVRKYLQIFPQKIYLSKPVIIDHRLSLDDGVAGMGIASHPQSNAIEEHP